MRPVWATALTFTLIAACGGSSSDSDNGASSGGSSGSGGVGNGASLLPCDVEAVVEDLCQGCHAEEPILGAPMALVDHDDVKGPPRDGEGTIAERMLQRMLDDAEPMPQPPLERASEAQIEIIRSWVEAGAPARAAGESCGGGSGGTGGAGGSGGGPGVLGCEPDVELRADEAWVMPEGVEDVTVCMGIEFSNPGVKRHITTIGAVDFNERIVHHFLLFEAPTAQPAEPTPCDLFPPSWKLVYAWAPGAPPSKLPGEAGFPMEEGAETHFVLQMHYNNYAGYENETDHTTVGLCTTDQLRQYDADLMSFGGIPIEIPPQAEAEMECVLDVPDQLGPWAPVTIFQAWPHMHAFGTGMKTVVTRADGSEEVMVDVPNYSWQNQLLYPVENMQIGVTDTVTTNCTWANTSAETVRYGEASNDEMCFNIVGYYPKITAPQFNGGMPAALAQCSMKQ